MVLREPLVGRGTELTILRDRLAEAGDGVGRLVLISGPAGLGKTRLAEELAAGADRGRTGWGAALPGAGVPPLWPWTRAVRRLAAAQAALASVRASRLDDGTAEDAAAAEFGRHTGVLDALEGAAVEDPPLIIVLDDLHWADEATLRLLDRLAAEIRRLPILVIGTHRPIGREALAQALPELRARTGTESLRLAPLGAGEARALLIGAVPDAEPSTLGAIADQTGGNPLYLHTIARAAPGLLRRPGGDSRAASALPELQDVIIGAVRDLGAQASAPLEALSVVGVETDRHTLAEISSTEELADRLAPATVAGLIEQTPGVVAFAHVLIRDAVYASLSDERRMTLHRRAAEVLQRSADGRPVLAGEVAEHWLRAGERAAGARWAVRAAAAATRAGAHRRAAELLALALEGHEPSGDHGSGSATTSADRSGDSDADGEPGRLGLLFALARALYLSGDLAGSLAACQQAAREGLASGDNRCPAKAAVIIQGVNDPDLIDQLGVLCEQALDALGPTGELELRARVEAQSAHVALESGDWPTALAWSGAALDHAVASGSVDAELDAVAARGPLTLAPGEAVERLELGRRAIGLGRRLDRPLAELWGHVWRIDAHAELADPASARDELEALDALAERTGLPLVRWHRLRQHAAWAALRGEFDRALQLSAETAEIAAQLRDVSATGVHIAFVLYLAVLRGDAGIVPRDVLTALPSLPRIPVIKANRALALLLTGQRAEAESAYRALPLHALDPANPLTLRMVADALEIAVSIGDASGCRQIAKALRVVRRRASVMGSGTVFFLGATARALGRAELAAGSVEEAVPLLEEGLGVDALLGARPFVVQGRLALANALQLRSAPGDLDRARRLASEAAAEARRLRLLGMLADADALLATLGREERILDRLTTREREVARLVAEACSNREIAERLVLSERTVEGHVRSILAKTGQPSRAAVIAQLVREGQQG